MLQFLQYIFLKYVLVSLVTWMYHVANTQLESFVLQVAQEESAFSQLLFCNLQFLSHRRSILQILS